MNVVVGAQLRVLLEQQMILSWLTVCFLLCVCWCVCCFFFFYKLSAWAFTAGCVFSFHGLCAACPGIGWCWAFQPWMSELALLCGLEMLRLTCSISFHYQLIYSNLKQGLFCLWFLFHYFCFCRVSALISTLIITKSCSNDWKNGKKVLFQCPLRSRGWVLLL